MAVYALYKYDFTAASEGALFAKGEEKSVLEQAQQIFEGLLTGKATFSIEIRKRDGTQTLLENEVLCKRDGVTVMLVCNEKNHKYVEKKEELEFKSHPGCYVIFDNREGVAQLAIERTAAFESNPDKVCLLLQNAINQKLFEYRLQIEIRSKVREASLWEIVENQTREYGDRIQKVVFNFPVPGKVAGIDASTRMKGRLATLAAIGRALNAAKASYHLEADGEKALLLDRTQKDLAQMVELCSTNAYDIHIKFQHYGLYRFGADEKALCSLEEEVLERFFHGQTVYEERERVTYELIQWLENVRRIIEGYKDAVPVKKTRKRSTKA